MGKFLDLVAKKVGNIEIPELITEEIAPSGKFIDLVDAHFNDLLCEAHSRQQQLSNSHGADISKNILDRVHHAGIVPMDKITKDSHDYTHIPSTGTHVLTHKESGKQVFLTPHTKSGKNGYLAQHEGNQEGEFIPDQKFLSRDLKRQEKTATRKSETEKWDAEHGHKSEEQRQAEGVPARPRGKGRIAGQGTWSGGRPAGEKLTYATDHQKQEHFSPKPIINDNTGQAVSKIHDEHGNPNVHVKFHYDVEEPHPSDEIGGEQETDEGKKEDTKQPSTRKVVAFSHKQGGSYSPKGSGETIGNDPKKIFNFEKNDNGHSSAETAMHIRALDALSHEDSNLTDRIDNGKDRKKDEARLLKVLKLRHAGTTDAVNPNDPEHQQKNQARTRGEWEKLINHHVSKGRFSTLGNGEVLSHFPSGSAKEKQRAYDDEHGDGAWMKHLYQIGKKHIKVKPEVQDDGSTMHHISFNNQGKHVTSRLIDDLEHRYKGPNTNGPHR